ncbi:hypothetical protein EDC04DRAFT_2642474 [Pisolithus marmoratus]|nr:hypothetical protein EDC04DRAFT_2642474 [Pisolithus marmoratus]
MTGIKVKVTYAKKRRRLGDHRKIQSSPLEAFPPDKDDVSIAEMVRRMLKRSRSTLRVTKCDNHTRPTQHEPATEQVGSSNGRVGVAYALPSDVQGSGCEERVGSSATTDSAFRTVEPRFRRSTGPVSLSPTKKPTESRRSKSSRTVSGILKENGIQRVSRKGIKSAFDFPTKPIRRQRHLSGPPTTYMRSQSILRRSPALFGPSSETLHIPGSTPHSPNVPFVGSLPQFQSTPPFPRADNSGSTSTNEQPSVAPVSNEAMGICDTGAQITWPTISNPQQLIHISANSIFSSSGDFTVGPDSPVKLVAMASRMTDSNGVRESHGDPSQVANAPNPLNYATPSPVTHISKYAVSKYAVPLHDPSSPPISAHQPNSPSTQRASTRVGKEVVSSHTLPKASPEPPRGLPSYPAGDGQPSRLTLPTKPFGGDALPDEVTQTTLLDLGVSAPHIDSGEKRLQSTSRRNRFHPSGAHVKGAIFSAKKNIAPKGKRADTIRVPKYILPSEGCVTDLTGHDSSTTSSQNTRAAKAVHFTKTSEGDDELLLQRKQRAKAVKRSTSLALKNWEEASSDELNLVAGKMWHDCQTAARCTG